MARSAFMYARILSTCTLTLTHFGVSMCRLQVSWTNMSPKTLLGTLDASPQDDGERRFTLAALAAKGTPAGWCAVAPC